MRRIFPAIALIFIIALPSASYALAGFGLEAAVGGWFQGDPEGTISYQGGDLDLADDLGFEGKGRLSGRLKLKHPVPVVPNLYLMATPMTFEGKSVRTFQFAGLNFKGDLESKLKLDHYDIALFWGVPLLDTATMGKFNVDFGLNARLMSLDASVKQTVAGVAVKDESTGSVFLPVPMLYLAAQLKPIDLLAIEGEGRGIAFSGHHYYSFIGRLKVKPVPFLFAAGGYRYDSIKIDDVEDVSADMKFKGPFVEAGVEF